MTFTSTSLCERCRWKRDVTSGRGSRFLLCERALQDANYAKYPAQPKWHCAGYEEQVISNPPGDQSA